MSGLSPRDTLGAGTRDTGTVGLLPKTSACMSGFLSMSHLSGLFKKPVKKEIDPSIS